MPEDKPGQDFPTEIIIVNDALEVTTNAANKDDLPVPPLTEDDRTLRGWAVQVLRRLVDSAGNTIPVGKEQEITALGTATGRPTVVLYGVDASSNEDPFRTNGAQEQLVGEGGPRVDVHDPVALTDTDAIILNPSASVMFWFWICNIHATTVATIDLGIDVDGSAGAVTAAGSIVRNLRLVPGENTGWMGPFNLTAADNLRGNADANSVASIHLLRRPTWIA